MSAYHYEREIHSEQVRVMGGDIAELAAVVQEFARTAEEGARWFTEDGSLVLESPLGESLAGGAPWPPAAQRSKS